MNGASRPRRALVLLLLAPLATLAALVGPSLPAGAAQSAARPDPRVEVVRLTNDERADHGCRRSLALDKRLTKSAQGHASDMAANGYFGHTSQDGRTWEKRIQKAGYRDPGGENIAEGFDTPSDVVGAWMDSPGHRRNILDCSFRRIGVGFDADGGYWVQDFGY